MPDIEIRLVQFSNGFALQYRSQSEEWRTATAVQLPDLPQEEQLQLRTDLKKPGLLPII